MMILFEGLDLSGKSTLCRAIQGELGCGLRHNSILPAGAGSRYAQADRYRREASRSALEIGEMYLNALGEELRAFQPSESPFIQDSTILLRSIAYHQATGNRELARRFRGLSLLHPRPVIAFVCHVSREVRLNRLAGRIARGNDAPEDLLVRDQPEVFTAMEEILCNEARMLFQAELLDTTSLENPEGRVTLVANVCRRIIALNNTSEKP